MLDIALLGCGGYMPLPGRGLTAMMARMEGRLMLIDCGEGTQVQMRKLGWGFKALDTICITHFHADHVAGLPGLLLTVGNSGRTEPLIIAGPRGVREITACLCVIAPGLPFELQFIELDFAEGETQSFRAGIFPVSALRLEHWGNCAGYAIAVPRAGRFSAARAQQLGLPVELWGLLQKGETVTHEGKNYTPDTVLGAPRRGIKVSYITDTRPTARMPEFIAGSDLFICEGIYGENELREKATDHRHMIFSEAAELARDGGAGELWLTHFSPSLDEPEAFLENASRIFPNTAAGCDLMTKSLLFQRGE